MTDQTPEVPVEDDIPVEEMIVREESTEKVDCPLCGKIFDVFVTQTFTPVMVDEDGWKITSERTADMTEVKTHIEDHVRNPDTFSKN